MSGPRNTLSDLNNVLFEQLERLNDDELMEDGLEDEVIRAKAMTNVANTIINNGSLALDAQKFMKGSFSADKELPRMLESKK